ncbi:MAG: HK97 family phage prohead protease [Gammaproteobacteria bacterium]|nr:MAG: HK97 family phage prohead protease [Gammaproteobacteria bacterium]
MLHKHTTLIQDCELKFSQDAPGRFEGYASVFGGNDSYNDTILKGAFAETLKSGKRPLMLYGHSPGRVIGKWVELIEDDKGLKAIGEFTPGHTDAQDVYKNLKFGALDGLSIGFRIPRGGSTEKDDGGRVIKAIDLVEISVVSMPADSDARVGVVKSEIQTIESLRDAELFLRDAGEFSRATATCFVSRLKELIQSDSEKALNEEITELRRKLEAKSVSGQLLDTLSNFKLGA